MSMIRCHVGRSSLRKEMVRRKSGFRRIPEAEPDQPEYGRQESTLSLPTISKILRLSEKQKFRRFSEGSNCDSKEDGNWVHELADITESTGGKFLIFMFAKLNKPVLPPSNLFFIV